MRIDDVHTADLASLAREEIGRSPATNSATTTCLQNCLRRGFFLSRHSHLLFVGSSYIACQLFYYGFAGFLSASSFSSAAYRLQLIPVMQTRRLAGLPVFQNASSLSRPLRAHIRPLVPPIPLGARSISLHHVQRIARLRQFAQKSPLATGHSVRSISESKKAIWRRPVLRGLYHLFAYCGIIIVGCGAFVGGVFLYDASTYREDPVVEDVPVSELALNPKRGGPKNLPIAEILVDDEDSEAMQEQRDKPKLVILGTGWGSVALLKTLNPGDYHVTVVSPVNYFLFTPMLPSATVGTLSLKSLVEPVRRIIHRVRGHFLKAEAEDIDFSSKLVEVSQVDSHGKRQHFYLPYDKLVIAVGRVTLADVCWSCPLILMNYRIYHESTRRQRTGALQFPENNRRRATDQEQGHREYGTCLPTHNFRRGTQAVALFCYLWRWSYGRGIRG